jgi:hypothetical protein
VRLEPRRRQTLSREAQQAPRATIHTGPPTYSSTFTPACFTTLVHLSISERTNEA